MIELGCCSLKTEKPASRPAVAIASTGSLVLIHARIARHDRVLGVVAVRGARGDVSASAVSKIGSRVITGLAVTNSSAAWPRSANAQP
jgi:hypothetical protein